MAAQDTIRRLRNEIAKARERGENDADIIGALVGALSPGQLLDLHKQAVREDRTSLESMIRKALYDRASSNGATVRGEEGHRNPVPIGAGVLSIPASDASTVAKAAGEMSKIEKDVRGIR
jgi:hypothetical protein